MPRAGSSTPRVVGVGPLPATVPSNHWVPSVHSRPLLRLSLLCLNRDQESARCSSSRLLSTLWGGDGVVPRCRLDVTIFCGPEGRLALHRECGLPDFSRLVPVAIRGFGRVR